MGLSLNQGYQESQQGSMNPSTEVPDMARKRQATRVLMGHQGITVKDMCYEDKIEGLQIYQH